MAKGKSSEKVTRSEQEHTAQVGGQAGGVNFAADIFRQDNVPSTINFARELADVQEAQVPSSGDPDSNEYLGAGEDAEGFIRNPVAGGFVSTGSRLGDFVNGVDHVEEDSDGESERVDNESDAS